MSERRTAILFGLGLVALMVLLQLGISTSGDKESSPTPTSSATPTTSPGAVAAREQGCPAALKLPDGAGSRVCLPVDVGDLTTLRSTKDPYSAESIRGFRSPSGAIACADVKGQTVACAVKGWTFDAGDTPKGETLILNAGRELATSDIKPPAAAVDAPETFAVPQVQFGQVVRMNAEWFCGVEEVGVSCWSPKANSGLLVSRNQWTTWSPEGIEGAS